MASETVETAWGTVPIYPSYEDMAKAMREATDEPTVMPDAIDDILGKTQKTLAILNDMDRLADRVAQGFCVHPEELSVLVIAAQKTVGQAESMLRELAVASEPKLSFVERIMTRLVGKK